MLIKTRKNLCAQALYATVKNVFSKKFSQGSNSQGSNVDGKVTAKEDRGISIIDYLMFGVALFALKLLLFFSTMVSVAIII